MAERWRAQGDVVEVRHLVSGKRKAAKSPVKSARAGGIAGSEAIGAGGQFESVAVTGWAAMFGSRRVPSEEVDRAFGMPLGKLRERAGIESLSYASPAQNELTLGDERYGKRFTWLVVRPWNSTGLSPPVKRIANIRRWRRSFTNKSAREKVAERWT